MIIVSRGKYIRRITGRTRKSCRGFVTLLLVQFDIDPPIHLSSFSCAPSSTLHFFLSFFLPFLDSRVEEPSGFNREGMKMFIHLEGIRAMIKERRE